MDVWRVETAAGHGPYFGPFASCTHHATSVWAHDTGELGFWFTANRSHHGVWRYGFSALDSLRLWFSDANVVQRLRLEGGGLGYSYVEWFFSASLAQAFSRPGFGIAKYDVDPTAVVRGYDELIFNSTRAVRVSFDPLPPAVAEPSLPSGVVPDANGWTDGFPSRAQSALWHIPIART